jgi:uncharacterized protein (DUF2147 family)
LFSESSAADSGVEGKWLVEKRDAIVLIEPKGDGLVGRLVWVKDRDGIEGTERLDMKNPQPDLRSQHVLGLVILTGLPLAPDESGAYRGGRIYNPKTGRTIPVRRMQLESSDLLKLRVGTAFIGKTTRWTRVDADSPPESR